MHSETVFDRGVLTWILLTMDSGMSVVAGVQLPRHATLVLAVLQCSLVLCSRYNARSMQRAQA